MGHLEIVEQIASYLADNDRRWSDELSEVATEYASLCREANDRLRRCGDYLRRGMRSEAVHLANCLPSLGEFLPALQIPDPEQWTAACREAGIPPPPRLQLAELEKLEAARLREQQLHNWLARHRILALAAAPVSERLTAARALAERDAENTCWPLNIRELESARLREMKAEAKRAFRENDAPALEAIAVELAAHAWLTQVPDDLTLGLKEALNKLRVAAAIETFKELLLQILPEYHARSYEQCAALMTKWRTLVDSKQLELPPEIKSQIRPVAAWLSAENHARGVRQRLKQIQPILKDQEKQLIRRAVWKRVRIAMAIGATIAAIAIFLFIRFLLSW